MLQGWGCGTTPALVLCAWTSRRHLTEGKASTGSTSSTSPSDKHSSTVSSDQDPRPAPERRSHRWIPRLLLLAVLLIVGLPLFLVAGIYLALQTEPGRAA